MREPQIPSVAGHTTECGHPPFWLNRCGVITCWNYAARHGWPHGPNEDEPTTAYDGSNAPQTRELTARERDILCRIISDILTAVRRGIHGDGELLDHLMRCIRLDSGDGKILLEIRNVIDPRRETE